MEENNMMTNETMEEKDEEVTTLTAKDAAGTGILALGVVGAITGIVLVTRKLMKKRKAKYVKVEESDIEVAVLEPEEADE